MLIHRRAHPRGPRPTHQCGQEPRPPWDRRAPVGVRHECGAVPGTAADQALPGSLAAAAREAHGSVRAGVRHTAGEATHRRLPRASTSAGPGSDSRADCAWQGHAARGKGNWRGGPGAALRVTHWQRAAIPPPLAPEGARSTLAAAVAAIARKLVIKGPLMSQANAEYAARDLAHVWHPCTQMKDHESLPPIPIRRGTGAWLEDYDGRRYLDAISSWWVNIFGHANPRINAAVRAQLEQLEQVILAGFTHEPVIALSEELCAIAPEGLTRCFYADNGSSAVEVAVKMSFHYWRNVCQSAKRRFLTLSNSYHGETLGALAVGDVELYKDIYRPLLMDVITVPSPDCYGRGPGE